MNVHAPLQSLHQGHWFKLICGASFHHLPAIRVLTLAFALAGADCIDVAADPAVVTMAQEALQIAALLSSQAIARGFRGSRSPWLMVSLNVGEDPHFRKAAFDATTCPSDSPRPCEQICPAHAITFQRQSAQQNGVIDERCYGCGRCLPVCPFQKIFTRSYVSTPSVTVPLVLRMGIEALEIHTQVGQFQDFQHLWQAIQPDLHQLKLVSISCPDGEGLIEYLASLYQLMSPLPCPLVWQTDGRPMSGDIGKGTTLAAVKLGQKVLAAGLPGYVQLAGGTNNYTVAKLEALGLLNRRYSQLQSKPCVAGIAYGSYARHLLLPLLEQLEAEPHKTAGAKSNSSFQNPNLETEPDLLWQMVNLAHQLVSQLKPPIRLAESKHAENF